MAENKRIIAHIDMDAFFASVEERDHPWMKGLPVVVGSDPLEGKGRGVVSTANYKAREYGIHSALPISIAWRFSEKAKAQGKPAAVFVHPNFSRYSPVSKHVMDILEKYASIVEKASIDEAYFDLSYAETFEEAEKICEKIKKEILRKEKLTASIGIGPNKLIAKIASDFQKPNGLTVITQSRAETFLAPMSVRKIPGIGPKTEFLLKQKGIEKIDDLKVYSVAEMKDMFGKWGPALYEKIRGIDNSPLEEEWVRKSIGEQETFLHDTLDPGFIIERMKLLCDSVWKSFTKSDFTSFQTVVITVRFSDFETKTRSQSARMRMKTRKEVEFKALKLLVPFLDKRENPHGKKIRLIGVRIEKLQ